MERLSPKPSIAAELTASQARQCSVFSRFANESCVDSAITDMRVEKVDFIRSSSLRLMSAVAVDRDRDGAYSRTQTQPLVSE